MDKWLIIPILVTIGLGQLIRWPIAGVSIPAIDLVVVVVVLIGGVMLLKNRSMTIPRPLMIGWFVLMVVFAVSWIVNLSVLGARDGLVAFLFLARFVGYGLLPFVLWPHLSSRRLGGYSSWLLMLFVWVAVLGWVQLGLFPDLQLFEYLGWDPHSGRLVSTFLDPNLVGIFLSFGVGLGVIAWGEATTRRDKIMATIIAVFLIISVLATFSRSALLSLVIVLLMVGWMRYRKAVGVGLMVVAVMFMFVPRLQDRLAGVWQLDTTARYRIASWQDGWELVKANPVFGVGYNAVASQRYKYVPEDTEQLSRQAENGFDSSLLTIAAASGLVGLLVWLGWVAMVLATTWHSWKIKTAVFGPMLWGITAGLLGASLFVNAWLTASMLVVWWLVIGLSWKEQE